MKLPYRNGTWFLVPLRADGYALGVVARHNGRGSAFGYFFGPKIAARDESQLLSARSPDKRILWGMVGDLGLVRGEWPIASHDPNWQDEHWPMPPFVRVSDGGEIAFMTEYDPITLKARTERRCPPSLINDHPYDRLMGCGSVELRLTELVAKRDGS